MEKSIFQKILSKVELKNSAQVDPSLPMAEDFLQNSSFQQKKPIGEILIEQNKISHEQLKKALHEQSQKGHTRLGDLLVESEAITTSDLLQSLAFQLDLPFFDTLPYSEIDPMLVNNIHIGFCKQHMIVPISRDKFGITVAICDPLNLAPIDDLRLILATTIYRVVSPPDVIEKAITSVFERKDYGENESEESEGDDDFIEGLDSAQDLLEDFEDAPARREVNLIIRKGITEGSSDIHIEPFEDRIAVRARIDGKLKELRILPKKMLSGITTRIKIIGKLDISESRIPQDGRIPIKIGNKAYELRLSCLPTKWGERIVMRIQVKDSGILTLKQLGMEESMQRTFEKLINQKHGIVLVTGPTGSGKTNTLASAIMMLNRPDTNIITIEDPVEITIPNVSQVEINPKAGLTFVTALRSILRQDPEIILVQEIRDAETALTAVNAAITGHMLFSTLHTNDTATSVTRLVDLGIEPYQIASSVLGVVAQRLLRRVCPTCRKEVSHTAEELALLGITLEDTHGKSIYKATDGGCTACRGTGYSGRTGIFELLILNDAMKQQILKSADGMAIKRLAQSQGMKTLRYSAAQAFLNGMTTLDEAVKSTQEDDDH